MHASVPACVYACVCAEIYVHMYVYACVCVNVYACVHVHMHICISSHVHTCTCYPRGKIQKYRTITKKQYSEKKSIVKIVKRRMPII